MEIIKFLKWQWQRFELWQKLFIFSGFLGGAGLVSDEPLRHWFLGAAALIYLGYIFKWAIWDGIKSSWHNYKQHRNELLTTIRDSHK